MELKGKIAVIAGASGGIGREITFGQIYWRQFWKSGYTF
ncbi:MAG: hypothetical protein US60_C0017G0012 [Microgenomates group bacterium GW2011_GWC1_37_8]|nr:MAG: hypothetical protein US60_C0017G0012 [Microgenomates group bacterium GW2011_GWC1_37_8]